MIKRKYQFVYLEKDGDVVAFVYQVGDGTIDHTYWGAPELQIF